MILSTSTAAHLFVDQLAKRVVEAAFSEATELTRVRVKRASEERRPSAFEDCSDCGSDLRSEAERSKQA